MIQERDFLMRMIRQLGDVLRAMKSGIVVTPEDQAAKALEQFLEEISGIPGELFEKSQISVLRQMLVSMADSNRKALSALAMIEMGRRDSNPKMVDLGQEILDSCDQGEMFQEVKDMMSDAFQSGQKNHP